jgi:transposase
VVSRSRLVITAVVVGKRAVAEVAAAYGVSRGWIYKLLARYEAEGEAAFEPRSRRPHSSPSATDPDVVDLVIRLRKELEGEGLDAGPQTVCWHVEHHHQITLSAATVAYLQRLTPPVLVITGEHDGFAPQRGRGTWHIWHPQPASYSPERTTPPSHTPSRPTPLSGSSPGNAAVHTGDQQPRFTGHSAHPPQPISHRGSYTEDRPDPTQSRKPHKDGTKLGRFSLCPLVRARH